jgi:hypothetical protein
MINPSIVSEALTCVLGLHQHFLEKSKTVRGKVTGVQEQDEEVRLNIKGTEQKKYCRYVAPPAHGASSF